MLHPEASHHLLQVLRKKAGDRFWLFNDNEGEFEATLLPSPKKTACVEVGQYHVRHTESPLHIHLGQAISRGERMDYAIQKAVELGVAEITPLFTEFCQVQLSDNRIEKRIAHWQAVAVSSAEQSGRCKVPVVHPPLSFSQWLEQKETLKFICCPRAEGQLDTSDNFSEKRLSVSIGAEGGFSATEMTAAFEKQFLPFSLGPRVLRTETAPVVALTLLQSRWGDLHDRHQKTR